ncbi:MAG: rod shape-determining protein [Candidatus Omnitrophica bacterium]|nr:rod shape-determining protein [Candidatus Omnitrophota bacterium]
MANFKEITTNIFNYVLGLFSNDMGIDLGTASTLVYVKGEGVVLCEPSVVAIERGTSNVLAVGDEAKRMLGRTPGNIIAIRPMKDGVIADFETVFLIEEPIAADIGVGLPIQEPIGNMIIDIGGGTTEIAVISLAGTVFSKSIRIGGDEMDLAIIEYLRKTYNVMIGERTAEDIKWKIGSAYPMDEEMSMEVRGRDLVAGLPKTVSITSEEIREALQEPIRAILESTKISLERTPPELSADLIEHGIVMAGGGSLLRGIDKLISEETGLPVHVAEDPLTAVVRGTGKVLDEMKYLKKVTVSVKSDLHS